MEIVKGRYCKKCGKDVLHGVLMRDPDEEKVYCEVCYNKRGFSSHQRRVYDHTALGKIIRGRR